MALQDSEAWQYLTEEEQVALTLQIGKGMSSWKVGEILGRNHYKYLEIFNRAKTFLKLFTEHLEVYHDIAPEYIGGTPEFREYITLCIKTRKKVNIVAKNMTSGEYRHLTRRKHELIKHMVEMFGSEDTVKHNFAVFVREFDRWNNFRILPKEVQELSAFPRRIKATFRKVLLRVVDIHDFFFEKLKKDYHNPELEYYATIFSEIHPDEKWIKVSKEPEIVDDLSKLGLFIFKTQEEAEHFHELVLEFDIRSKKHCKKGQKFWPQFREAVKYCINTNRIQQIIPHSSFYHIK
jgi:hypothetical protein